MNFFLSNFQSPIDTNNDERMECSSPSFEEQGYEADQDSDDSSDCTASSHYTTLFVADQSKSSISLLTTGKNIGNLVHVKHPWFVINLLEILAAKVKEEKSSILKIVKESMTMIYEYQLLDPYNNTCLKEKVKFVF